MQKPRVSKSLTINLQGYEALRLAAENCVDFMEADGMLLDEIARLGITPTEKILRCLGRTPDGK